MLGLVLGHTGASFSLVTVILHAHVSPLAYLLLPQDLGHRKWGQWVVEREALQGTQLFSSSSSPELGKLTQQEGGLGT